MEIQQSSGLSTQLDIVSKALAEIDAVSSGIADLKQKYGAVVFDVTTAKGMVAAKAARTAVRDPRYKVETIRKTAKRPILDLGKKLDTEAERITIALREIEDPIDAQITAEEERKERERLAKIEAEQKRVADIQERIEAIRSFPDGATLRTAAQVQEMLDTAKAKVIDDSFEEFKEAAEAALRTTIHALAGIHYERVQAEAEQARIAAEREELARLRKAEEERQAAQRARISEEERVAKTARDAEAAKQAETLRLEREAQAAETARQRAEQETAARVERERIAEEERVAKAARDAETARHNEALRKQREEQEANAERGRMRMSELQGIQHQVMIATLGRAGVRTGGTRECITETLAETEAWEITEEKFGPLFGSAQNVKASAITAIRALLEQFDQGAAQAAEAKRLVDQLAEIERRQGEIRRAQETPPAPPPLPPAPVSRRGVSVPVPSATEMVDVLAKHYRARPDTIMEWLRAVDWNKAEAA